MVIMIKKILVFSEANIVNCMCKKKLNIILLYIAVENSRFKGSSHIVVYG